MYCPECGEEIYLKDKFGDIDYTYCEKCGYVYSIKSCGIDQEAIREKQRCLQENYEKEVKTGGDQGAVNRLLANNQQNQVNLHSPNNRVDSDIGEIRTRYTYRDIKGA
ncbi:hypothetical protein [Sporohalobacter salinus]|uniref:hypothetical protein n=1 Tax=Sporohalobacter salinus TaxID=1494606 RepID=UPI0019605E00|nr:hypothetical protein [Sporohalobacter salinus]MBM7624766.1 DNA-directed RNA polymerase subunit M/transcription elongation factor TFIIS [Sporohalobacter salinus]